MITPLVRAGELVRRDWDAIVVGSGVGGLVVASLLASRANKRVLVLERHYEPGGLTQTFKRRRYAWDIGVHYLGDLAPGSLLHRTFDAAGAGRLRWARLPERHDRLIAPGLDARFGGDRSAWRAQLLALCPGEERALDRVLEAVTECTKASQRHMLARIGAAAPARSAFHDFSDRTTAEVLSDAGVSPRLAALLTYTWTDYGAPPDRSSFAAHAMATAHYSGGAYYPEGGGGRIARAMCETIAEHRGATIVRADVDEILIGDRARGVRLTDGREIAAPIVISNAGAHTTFERLVRAPSTMREAVRAIGPSYGHVGLYLGLRSTPRALGLDGANLWIQRDPIGESARDAGPWADGDRAAPPEMFVSTACATDPTFAGRYPGRTAIPAAVAVPSSSFARWHGTRHARRGPEYEAHKRALAESMSSLLSPHLSLDTLEHIEVSTPLSTAHFAGQPGFLDPTPLRFRRGPGPHTGIPGFFLTGQDIWLCGIGGAASAGVLTASAITRRDLVRELAVRW
jgi:all-trans-retinol 13,14-reductase